jgi:hypothetical protein
MTWDQTYSHTLLLAIARAAAAVVFNEPDITVSGLCWIVHFGTSEEVAALKLYNWQHGLLVEIGGGLEHFFPGHLAATRQGDIDASARSRKLLGVKQP